MSDTDVRLKRVPDTDGMRKQIIIECLAEQVVKLRGILQQVREDMWFCVGPSKDTIHMIDEVLGPQVIEDLKTAELTAERDMERESE